MKKAHKLILLALSGAFALCVLCVIIGLLLPSSDEAEDQPTDAIVAIATGIHSPTVTRTLLHTNTPQPTGTPSSTNTPRPTATLTASPAASLSGQWMVVSARTAANVRSGPSDEAPIVATLPRGTRVQVLAEQNGRCQVACDLLQSPGWVAADLLAESLPAPSTATPSATSSPTPVPVRGALKVHFVDVGQGDAILITSPDGKTALIDGGDAESGIVPYLRSQGVQRIDLMIATHPHADHIGGLTDVLRAFPVDEVVTNGQPHTTLTYERFLDAIIASKATYTEVSRGDVLQLGSLTFEVLHPPSSTGQNLNNQSLVLRLTHGKVAFLLTGDIEREAESSILGYGRGLSASFLKVAHHGSRSSSSSTFLAKVAPKVAIYSCGLGNSFGHPHPETLTALTQVGATIYGTDVNGTIVVTSDGSSYSIRATKQGESRAPPAMPPAAPPLPTATPTKTVVTPRPAAPAIEVVSLTSPVAPGANARLSIKTTPGAACAITVYYKSGASQAAGLGPQNANANGIATWQWKVGTRTTPGTWRIVVTATVAGQRVTREIDFEVRK